MSERKKPTPDQARRYGVDPNLTNYFNFFGWGECEGDCPIHAECLKMRGKMEGVEIIKEFDVVWVCPIGVISIGDEATTI